MEITDMNEAGAVSYRYDPYGAVTITHGGQEQSSDPLGQPWTFTGRFHDEETGLYYYRARYYDAEMGRFLQRDPLGYAPGPNLYTYVEDAPTNGTDPFGRAPSYSGDECKAYGTGRSDGKPTAKPIPASWQRAYDACQTDCKSLFACVRCCLVLLLAQLMAAENWHKDATCRAMKQMWRDLHNQFGSVADAAQLETEDEVLTGVVFGAAQGIAAYYNSRWQPVFQSLDNSFDALARECGEMASDCIRKCRGQ
jgi:RHS repeat-associated protein